MGVNRRKILILNGSPRAPRSNSKRYAALFTQFCGLETETMDLLRADPKAVAERIEGVSDVLLVFPLYADAIPVPVLRAFQALEETPPQNRPTVSVLVNCGFLEPEQCDVAVAMVELFCKRMGWPVGSVLEIGSGEAILDQPFRFCAKWKIKALARAVAAGRSRRMKVTMPISKAFFLKASTKYWLAYGERNGVTGEQMATMEIEGQRPS